jgi:hypothetical protein
MGWSRRDRISSSLGELDSYIITPNEKYYRTYVNFVNTIFSTIKGCDPPNKVSRS